MRIAVRVIPRSSRDGVDGERDGRLVVRTTAPPVDDAANDAVVRIVATHLGVRPREVAIVSGQRSRDKVLEVPDSGPSALTPHDPHAGELPA
ncbi:MAG: DUF167 domain-containing protein [Ilumatobacteraceae bacterium]|jgi:hypothetical protein|nr:DUF167 domain-containing protein [Ilumatobacteraceae bacterium]